MCALPLYLWVPSIYSERFGVPIAWIGAVLLATRLLDALIDPWLGGLIDRHREHRYRFWILCGLPALLIGYGALFGAALPAGLASWLRAGPYLGSQFLVLLWMSVSLILVQAAYSLVSIAHQAWGAEIASDPVGSTRVTTARELPALAGILIACVLPEIFGFEVLAGALLASTLLSAFVLHWAPVSSPRVANGLDEPSASRTRPSLWQPFQHANFRSLYLSFLANGIASAIPATLVLLYMRDVLGLDSRAGYLLALYFLAGACSMPVWVALSARWGLARAWAGGMALALLAFAWAWGLGREDAVAFGCICVLTGVSLGADLTLPAAALAGIIEQNGHRGQSEATYFGLWNMASKLNLAIAAGLSLPLLAWSGYNPLQPDAQGRFALAAAYALLPCAFKVLALVLWLPSASMNALPLDIKERAST
jgi:Na+/melibiose symporter-like transporter